MIARPIASVLLCKNERDFGEDEAHRHLNFIIFWSLLLLFSSTLDLSQDVHSKSVDSIQAEPAFLSIGT